MRRGLTCFLLQAAALAASHQVDADTLPAGAQVTHGDATVTTPSANQLNINQTTNRAVVRWDSFDIGQTSGVTFDQPDSSAATLNIVDSATSSTLSGSLTATGAVFLINPHGLTVTSTGTVDTGGAFVASTLSVSDTAFMDGSNTFQFNGSGGAVSNAGAISASDVLLLGSRVENLGDIVSPMGRVALGSASQATLDLSGDGFLQVLAPATVGGSDALVSNSGDITADGGLVQLRAATVRDAMRDAVNMPGTVRARSVSGQDGAIVFHGGEGGTVTTSGSVDTGIDSGGSVALSGAVLDADLQNFTVGAGGQLSLTADNIEISVNGTGGPGRTAITENTVDSQIGNVLRAGTNVTLQANNDIRWSGGLMMAASGLTPESGGQAGNLHMLAGRSVSLGAHFSSVNGDWTVTANAKPVVEAAREAGFASINMWVWSNWTNFYNNNGHLTLEILDGGGDPDRPASSIQLPMSYSGNALTARIDPGVANYDEADIRILGDIGVAGDITLSGHLRTTSQTFGMRSLSGARVNWTTETTGGRLAGGLLRFVEGGEVTRFGGGGSGPSGPGVDAVRLELGSDATVSRVYGDSEPDQSALGDALLSVADHNTVSTAGVILSEVLADGSIAVSGPGAEADAGNDYQLNLSATADIALYGDFMTGGDEAGAPYWIDLSVDNASASRVPLQITPRTVTATALDPSYTYGSPDPAVSLSGVVNGDVIVPTGTLGAQAYTFESVGSEFGFYDRLDAGSHSYSVTGLTGARAGNYQFAAGTSAAGTVTVSQKLLDYGIRSNDWIYGSTPDFNSYLGGLLSGDDVQGVVSLTDGSDVIDLIERLPVGTYQAKLTGLTGTDAGNYVLMDDWDFRSTHTVLPKPVTWHADDKTSVYGTLADLGTADLDGVLSGDQVVGEVTTHSPLAFNTPAGRFRRILRVNSLSGRDAGNYELSINGNTYGNLWILPKPLTWQTSDGSSEFGTVPVPGDATLSGVLEDDEVNGITALYAGNRIQHNLGIQTPAGSYTVHVAALDGADSSNYRLAGSGNVVADYEITPKPLNWSLGTVRRRYGDSLSLPGQVTLTGLVGDDRWDNNVGSELGVYDNGQAVPTYGTIRLSAGEYELRPLSLTGPSASNYTLAGENNTPGTLIINPRVLGWSLGSASNVYGNVLNIPNYSFDDLLQGDVVKPVISALPHSMSEYTTKPDVGTWNAYITDITGRDAGNYVLENPSSSRNTPGQLTITPRPLIYRSGIEKVYGETFGLNMAPLNLLEGDDIPLLQFEILDPGGNTVGTYWNNGQGITWDGNWLDAGTYRIQPLRLSRSGVQPLNYMLLQYSWAQRPASAGLLSIKPRKITGSVTLNLPEAGDNYYEADYLDYGPESVRGEVRANGSLDGVLWGDDVALRLDAPNIPQSSQGYHQAGTYSWYLNGLTGADAGNYALDGGNNRAAHLTINPLTVTVRAMPQQVVYGDTEDYNLDIEPLFGNSAALEQAFADDHLRLWPGAYGVWLPDGTVAHQLPYNLPVGSYEIWGSENMFTGPDVENFRSEFLGFDLTVTPRPLTVTGKNPELVYGDDLTLNTLFELEGVLAGDDALFADDTGFLLSGGHLYSPDTHLRAGSYWVRSEQHLLTGEDASNYQLPVVSTSLIIARRPLYLQVNETPIYGDVSFFDPEVLGIVPSEQALFDEQARVDVSLTDDDGGTLTDGSVPVVGQYTLNTSIPETWLRNYELPPAYTLDIQRRPVRAGFLHNSLVYGSERPSLFGFTLDSDDSLTDTRPGILPGDEVYANFVLDQPNRQEESELVYNEYLPVGTYDVELHGLGGSAADNYKLTNRRGRRDEWANGEWVTTFFYSISDLHITPKPVQFSDIRNRNAIYGDAIPLADLSGILPEDEVAVSFKRGGDNLSAIVEDGVVIDTSAPSAGDHHYTLLDDLTGRDSSNYRIVGGGERDAEVTVDKRKIVYAIDNVVGQYGNFKGCEDPSVPELCNLSFDSEGNAYADIWAPLELDANLFNWIEGDDVSANVGLVDPADGSLLTLADKPVPGTYLQVVTNLTGADAHNYDVAETGNAPGVLTMTPKWVGWSSFGGFYSRDTGIVTHSSTRLSETEIPFHVTLRTSNPSYGVEPEHKSELTPVMEIHAHRYGETVVWWKEGETIPPSSNVFWSNSSAGAYSIVVTDLEGPNADYYRPLPTAFVGGESGHVGMMIVTSLGDFDSNELNPALVEERERQVERQWDWLNDENSANDDDDLISVESGASDTRQTSGNDGRTGGGSGGGNTPVSDDNVSVSSDAYIDTLAEYGVTGVTLQAGAGAEVEVDYQVGAGYVRVGAEVDADGQVRFSYSGLTGSGSVRAGVRAATGVDGSLGGLGDGSASVGAETGAFAKGKFSYGFQDGRVTYTQETMTGAGGRVTVNTSISGQYGAADVGAAVYPPGTLGAGFGAGGGFEDGSLSFNLRFSLAVGVIGGSFDISGAIDVEAMAEGAVEAARYIERFGEEFGCVIGLGDCSPPSAAERRQMLLERGREILSVASNELRYSPVDRFALLASSNQWRSAELRNENATDEERRAYQRNLSFYEQFDSMRLELRRFNDTQEQLRATFERALRQGDTSTAVRAMRSMTVNNNMDDLIASLNQQGRALGVGIAVVDGDVRFVNR